MVAVTRNPNPFLNGGNISNIANGGNISTFKPNFVFNSNADNSVNNPNDSSASTSLKQTLVTCNGSIDSGRKQVQGYQNDVDKQDTKLGSLNKDLMQGNDFVAKKNGEIAVILSKQAIYNTTISGFDSTIGGIDASLSSIDASIGGLQASANAKNGKNDPNAKTDANSSANNPQIAAFQSQRATLSANRAKIEDQKAKYMAANPNDFDAKMEVINGVIDQKEAANAKIEQDIEINTIKRDQLAKQLSGAKSKLNIDLLAKQDIDGKISTENQDQLLTLDFAA